jgi:hypothetical protein
MSRHRTTIDEALALTDELLTPTRISTRVEGKWVRVVGYELPELTPAAGPSRACWTCAYWSEKKKCCRKWDAVPPDDVQKIGCDAWKLEEVPF